MSTPRDTTGDSDDLIARAQRPDLDYEEIDGIIAELIERIRTLEKEKYEAIYEAWENAQGDDI